MPLWLKKATRIEILLERGLRHAMVAAGVDHLPRYPEERECRAPSAERVLEVFASLQRHDLWPGTRRVHTFQPQFDAVQERIVSLLGVPAADFIGRYSKPDLRKVGIGTAPAWLCTRSAWRRVRLGGRTGGASPRSPDWPAAVAPHVTAFVRTLIPGRIYVTVLDDRPMFLMRQAWEPMPR